MMRHKYYFLACACMLITACMLIWAKFDPEAGRLKVVIAIICLVGFLYFEKKYENQ